MDGKFRNIVPEIESPPPIIFWEPAEFVAALTIFGVGMTFDLFIFGACAAVGILMGARYLKRGAKKGATPHYLWSIGLRLDPIMKKFPGPWDNDYID